MHNYQVELQYKTMEYFGSRPTVSVKITADPHEREISNLEATTLIFFDGPSLGKLNLREEIRTKFTWKHYGKLSVRDPPSSKLEGPAWELFKGTSSAVGLSFLYHLLDMYKEIKGRRETSRMKWNLVFSNEAIDVLRGLEIGSASYSARKYERNPYYARRIITDLCTLVGEDSLKPLDDLVKNGLLNLPFILTKTSYFIPPEKVNHVLGHKGKKTGKYPNPTLVARTTVDLSGINPNDQRNKHFIHAVTKIADVLEIYVSSIEFPGPKYFRIDN